MDKTIIYNFIKWLELASNEEIYTKKDKVTDFLSSSIAKDIRNDAELALHLIEEELFARKCLKDIKKA